MSDFETIIRNPKEFGNRLLDLKNKKKYCDIEIVVDTVRIAVHKHILASSSAYFDTLFSNYEKKELRMEYMDLEIVQSLIEYCYTGIIRIPDKNTFEIMRLANFLKMTPITEGCEEILKKKMDFSNCISTWKFAKREHFENLRSISFEYARQNYEKVSQMPEFLDLDESEILELLNSDIAVTSETVVLNSVKKWINQDSVSRKQYPDKLFNFIRFENIPKNILLSESHNLCSENSSCYAKIINTVQLKEKNNFVSADNSLRDSYSTLTVVGSEYYNKPKTMEIFDLRNDKWTKIEKFECDKISFSAVLLEHKLMFIGGEIKKNNAVNTVQSYDLNTGTLENLPPMKYARHKLAAVEFQGSAYAIGGWDKSPLAYVEMWDPVSQKWKELTSMPTPRSECEAVVIEEEIFVVGGYDGYKYHSDTESYNPETDKWKKCAMMNERRTAPGVIFFGGYLYAVGGHNSKTAERYDHTIDKWTTIHSLEITRGYMGVGKLFGKFVIVGGLNNDQNLSSMEMFDDEKDNWISMSSLNKPRYLSRVVEIPWSLAKAMISREVPK